MKKLYETFQQITPDPFNVITEELKSRKEEIIVEPIQKKRYYRYMIPVTLMCLVVLCVMILQKPSQVAATIGLDVNPSLTLDIDDKQKIITVKAQNEDAKKIIGDMKLEGSDIEVGVNALIGAMLKEGYIDELKNSLLISVTGDNHQQNEELRKTLSLHIDEYLKDSQINGAIVSQTIDVTDEINKLAKQYQISIGKAEIIQELVQKNSRYTFESLKDLSVNELNILLHKNDVKEINMTGEVNEGSYIGKEKAKQIAISDAKVTQPTYQQVELDYDDGVMIYEVEFSKNGVEYDYDIDALSGKILKKDKEGKETASSQSSSQSTSSSQQPSNITEAKAKSIAMNHAGVQSVSQYTLKKDYDDGQLEYEIEFVSGQYKYEYTIRARDGRVLDSEKENVGEVSISADEAKKKAFAHANVQSSQALDIDVELKKKYYEVSFTSQGYEYEYHVDSRNGNILHHEKEKDD